MKKMLLAAIAAVTLAVGPLAVGQASADDWNKVRIATEGAYAPWNFTDSSGKLVGFELDLARDLCARMGAECEIVAQAWDGIIPALNAGKYDAIMAGMSITDKRKKVISFSNAYAATPARFVVLKNSDHADFTSKLESLNLEEIDGDEQAVLDQMAAAFKGETIGVQVATTHENFLREFMGDTVEIRTYDTQENLDLDLQAGRVGMALASMSYWKPLLETEKGKDFTAIGAGMTGGPFGGGVGVGIRQADAALVEKFNKAIAEATADGTVSKLAIQWFGFDASY
ncbi:MAG: transporter substrate-binding domain-containing protein [Alphaproteobacteria bacterium]|nr:transporter substrate-binding domain-containing protein [Alphaproteobacteria bacterium]